MNFYVFSKIKAIVNRYSKTYSFYNRSPDLTVSLETNIDEYNKELLLNELDVKLPLGINFQHQYKNGKLKIIFKELI